MTYKEFVLELILYRWKSITNNTWEAMWEDPLTKNTLAIVVNRSYVQITFFPQGKQWKKVYYYSYDHMIKRIRNEQDRAEEGIRQK